MKTGKVWGSTEPELVTPGIEIHRLSIRPNSWCSRHRHHHKSNAFLVVSGVLHVRIEREYGVDETTLGAGQMTRVEPRYFHKFWTGPEGAEIWEIYYPPVLSGEDIERTGVGGSADAVADQEAADHAELGTAPSTRYWTGEGWAGRQT